MQHINIKLCFLVIISLFARKSLAEINIFACEPEWAALSKEVGGELVTTYSATNHLEDPHYIRAKPSLIAAFRGADFVVCSGASLEVGWLPTLIEKVGGNIPILYASSVVSVLDKPEIIDRSHGDIHPEGNPHVHLNPHNLILVAKEIEKKLSEIDKENSLEFKKNLEVFRSKIQAALLKWETIPNKYSRVFVFHSNLTYLLNWRNISVVGTLEAKPGIPPSASHLESLVLNPKLAQAIVVSSIDPKEASTWLSEKTKLPVITIPYTVGGEVQDLIQLLDTSIRMLGDN